MPPRRRRTYKRNALGRFRRPRPYVRRGAALAGAYLAYGARRLNKWYQGRRAFPRTRGRMGNAVGFIGVRNIRASVKNSISKKKSEQYTIDFAATDGAAIHPGVFNRIVATTPGQDMSLAGYNRHPIIKALVGAAYGTRRVGLSINETFHKQHLCVSAPVDQLSTCNRIVLLEVIDRNTSSRSAPNSYQWQDFFENPTVTSFYAMKRQASDTTRSMVKYKVIMDRSLVLNDLTTQNEKLVNFNIPKHTVTVAETTAAETDTSPTLQQGSKRYILFMVTDAATDAARPIFTGEVRCKFMDP